MFRRHSELPVASGVRHGPCGNADGIQDVTQRRAIASGAKAGLQIQRTLIPSGRRAPPRCRVGASGSGVVCDLIAIRDAGATSFWPIARAREPIRSNVATCRRDGANAYQ
jgi:hypothetical protein